jgi:hypothetical protein
VARACGRSGALQCVMNRMRRWDGVESDECSVGATRARSWRWCASLRRWIVAHGVGKTPSSRLSRWGVGLSVRAQPAVAVGEVAQPRGRPRTASLAGRPLGRLGGRSSVVSPSSSASSVRPRWPTLSPVQCLCSTAVSSSVCSIVSLPGIAGCHLEDTRASGGGPNMLPSSQWVDGIYTSVRYDGERERYGDGDPRLSPSVSTVAWTHRKGLETHHVGSQST